MQILRKLLCESIFSSFKISIIINKKTIRSYSHKIVYLHFSLLIWIHVFGQGPNCYYIFMKYDIHYCQECSYSADFMVSIVILKPITM